MNSFSISESLSFAWSKIRAHSRLVFSATLILAALELVMRFFAHSHPTRSDIAVEVCGTIIGFVLSVGFTVITLKLSRGERASLRELIPQGRILWQYFLASLRLLLLTIGGIIVLILAGLALAFLMQKSGLPGIAVFAPVFLGVLAALAFGIWFVLQYFLVRIAAVDGVRPVREIFADSARISGGQKWNLFLFLLVLALINIAGSITYIGILLSIPITSFATVYVYLKLTGHAGETVPATIEQNGEK